MLSFPNVFSVRSVFNFSTETLSPILGIEPGAAVTISVFLGMLKPLGYSAVSQLFLVVNLVFANY